MMDNITSAQVYYLEDKGCYWLVVYTDDTSIYGKTSIPGAANIIDPSIENNINKDHYSVDQEIKIYYDRDLVMNKEELEDPLFDKYCHLVVTLSDAQFGEFVTYLKAKEENTVEE